MPPATADTTEADRVKAKGESADRKALLALALLTLPGDEDAAVAFWREHAPKAYRGLLDGDGWTWDAETQTYTSSSGTTIGTNELKRLSLTFTLGVETSELEPLAQRMTSGDISVSDWQTTAATTAIRPLYVAQALLAVGGVGNLAPEDIDAVEGSVKGKTGLRYAMDRLSRFGEQVAGASPDDQVTRASIVNRAGMYAEPANAVMETVKRNSHRRATDDKGRKLFLFERNRLDPASEHCVSTPTAEGCVNVTAAGWQRIGTLSQPGHRACSFRCRCSMAYALVPTGSTSIALGATRFSRRSTDALWLSGGNPYHDDRGRFTSGADAGSAFGSGSSPVVSISGDELGANLSDKELRKAAEAFARQNLQGKSFVNRETGRTIAISRRGIAKVMHNTADIRRAKLVVAIPQMIEHGRLATSNDEPNRGTFHRFDVAVSIAGQAEPANFLVNEDHNGHWYYNHGFGKVSK